MGKKRAGRQSAESVEANTIRQLLIRGVREQAFKGLADAAKKRGDKSTVAFIATLLNLVGEYPAALATLLSRPFDIQLSKAQESLEWGSRWLTRAEKYDFGDPRRSGHLRNAVSAFAKVVEPTHEQQFPGLASFAFSRLAVCLVEIAVECEWRAVCFGEISLLDEAISATAQATALNQKYQDKNWGFDNLSKLGYFNAAACMSVQCRLMVHRSLLKSNSRLIHNISKEEFKKQTKLFEEARNAQWEKQPEEDSDVNTIGMRWRSAVSEDVVRAVDEVADEAMLALDKITLQSETNSNELLDAEVDHWVYLTGKDPDYMFLQSDRKFAHDYKDWRNRWELTRRSSARCDHMLTLAMQCLPLHLRTSKIK